MYQSKTIFQCPYCGDNIIKDEGDETIVRNRILKTKKNTNITIVRCKECGREVEIPVTVLIN